jgi:transcriptional regulator with GAF, ATPase, and Fis domain
MGDQLHLGWLSVLADIADAAAASNTRRSLARRTGEALAQYLSLDHFELGWCEDARLQSAVVVRYEHDSDVKESVCALSGTEVPGIIRGGKPYSVTDAGEHVVVIPLRDPEQAAPGYARITMIAGPGNPVPPQPILETLGRVLAFGQRHCRLVERIARLSSAAHRETRDVREELRRYTEHDPIVARSPEMRRVLEATDLVAGHDTTVLLRGESGTGKELLARRIHRLSSRARHPFVAVNCGALPETLVESELFGHEKGAFTGAAGRYRGRFERANSGTIFLDEIAELSQAAQVKLLRVLQEGVFERLGGEETVHVNVRILAATHQPLEDLMEQGKFRRDLFYRIAVFPIAIPPLRERRDDILPLARSLLDAICKRLGCAAPALDARSIEKLLAHPWRGNVRELANALERAVIVSRGAELAFHDLTPAAASAPPPAVVSAETFDEGARRTIHAALKACRGKIYGQQGAAARLGVAPSTLQGKMRRLRISRRDFVAG